MAINYCPHCGEKLPQADDPLEASKKFQPQQPLPGDKQTVPASPWRWPPNISPPLHWPPYPYHWEVIS